MTSTSERADAGALPPFEVLYSLSQRLLSAPDVDAVCRAAVETARDLLQAEFVTLLQVNAQGSLLFGRAVHGWDESIMLQPGLSLDASSQAGYTLTKREPIMCENYATEQRFQVAEVLHEKHIRSGASVPLLIGDRPLGVLLIHSCTPGHFKAQDLGWLMLLANLAAAALDKVRLYEKQARRAERLRLINEISRRLNRSLDFDEQIRGVVVALAELFGYSDVSVLMLDASSGELSLHSAAGPTALPASRGYRQSVEVGIMGHVARMGQSYFARDLSQDRYYYHQPTHEVMGAEVCVPIRDEMNAVLGVLNIESPETDNLTEEDLVAAETIADQLSIALRNARLYRQARARLEHLLALQATVIDIAGQRDLSEMLRRIVERAAGLLGADCGTLYLLTAERTELELVVAHRVPHAFLHSRIPLGMGVAGRVAATGEPMMLEDYGVWDGGWPDYAELNIGAVVGVPMKWQGNVIGELDVWQARDGRTFDQDNAWLLSLYADQAAMAIESARLLEAEQQRRGRLAALYQIAQTLNATLDTRGILNQVTEEAMRATGATHGLVLIVNESEGVFERHVMRGFAPELMERGVRVPLPLSRGVNGRAYATRQVVLSSDVARDADYVRLVPETRAELVVPILRGTSVLANIDLQSPLSSAFSNADLDFLRALADQAAIALENARLLENARRRLGQLTVLHEVALVAATTLDLDSLLEGVTAILVRGLLADHLGVLLAGGDGLLRFHRSYRGLTPSVLRNPVPPGNGVCGTVFASNQPMLIGDTSLLTGIDRLDDRTRAQMCVPLVASGETIGVINVESLRVGAYGDADLRLLTTLAGQVATAVEKLRLLETRQRYATQLEQRVLERTQALREQNERTEAILRSVAEAVLLVDAQGEIVVRNPVAEELLADNTLGPQLVESAHRLALHESNAPEVIQGRGETFEAHGAPVTAGEQKLGVVIVVHNVTHLYELNRMKSEFVSNVSHELRTPLTNMKMYINLLQKGRAERHESYIETLRREAGRLERLVEDLLTISRLDTGATQVNLRQVQVNSALAMLVVDRQALAADRGLVLLGQWSPSAPPARVDEQLIVQAIGNLVSNAMAYTPPGGCIIVRSEAEVVDNAHWLALRVSDTGPGIPSGERERVFERFYRGEAAHSRNVPGTGMGLAIVKEIVTRHHGRVFVSSEVGRGATFTILLPAA